MKKMINDHHNIFPEKYDIDKPSLKEYQELGNHILMFKYGNFKLWLFGLGDKIKKKFKR